MTMDTLIIVLCVAAAVAFIGSRVYRAVRGTGGGSCGCNCSRSRSTVAQSPLACGDGSCCRSGARRPR